VFPFLSLITQSPLQTVGHTIISLPIPPPLSVSTTKTHDKWYMEVSATTAAVAFHSFKWIYRLDPSSIKMNLTSGCLNCGKYGTIHICEQCHVADYCSRECQLARLNNHGCKPTKAYLDRINDTQWNIYYRYKFEQDFNGKTRVLRKDRLVYKFCKTEAEYLETIVFYEAHQEYGIVPVIFTTIDNAWLIVTHLVEGFTLLGESFKRSPTVPTYCKEKLQYALIMALAKFKSNSFGLDSIGNLQNIGYNDCGKIIFYENNGKQYAYASKSQMIFQFLQLLKFREPRVLGTIWNEETIKRYIE